jgi:hypothetical protein
MRRTDLEVAKDFVHRWLALPKERRGRLGRQIPLAAVQTAALCDPDLAMRRFCLFLLDHYASDASVETFRRALRDPVASVREGALHGLSCERCRDEEICVSAVVTDLVDILATDPDAAVRHKTVGALARFAGRDNRAGAAVTRAAQHDPDPAIRGVAQAVVDGALQVSRRTARGVRRAARARR